LPSFVKDELGSAISSMASGYAPNLSPNFIPNVVGSLGNTINGKMSNLGIKIPNISTIGDIFGGQGPNVPATSGGILPQENSSMGPTQALESLMTQVLQELKSINGNTGNANGFLEAINGKEFGVDQKVRDTIHQLGKVNNKKAPVPYNHGNTRTINSLIRPQ
jgi:hypothetical protein